MPRSLSDWPLTALIAIGTCCRLSLRKRAVTTISPGAGAFASAGAGACAASWAKAEAGSVSAPASKRARRCDTEN
jgi:hypothetical protein